jgi:hypothetical protein
VSQNIGSLLLPPASLEELDISPGIVIDIMLRLLFTVSFSPKETLPLPDLKKSYASRLRY